MKRALQTKCLGRATSETQGAGGKQRERLAVLARSGRDVGCELGGSKAFGGRAMAVDLNTPEGRAAEMKLEPDFHGLLERKALDERSQALVASVGVVALSRFSSLADTKAEIRTFCQETLGLHRVNDAVAIAGMVDAWTAAQSRMEARHKAEAEADLAGMPQTLNKAELQDLRTRFEGMHYAVEEKAAPSNGTLELVCDQIESGEWKVMTLAQFQSREDAETDVIGCVVEKSGLIKIRRGFKEGVKPNNPEQLRQRLKLSGTPCCSRS